MEVTQEIQAPSASGTISPAMRAGSLLALGSLVSLPYFWLERHVIFPARVVPMTALDRAIPFVPLAAWLYISLYAQLTLPLWLARDPQRLRQMLYGFAWIAVISHIMFLFWPTAVPSFPWPATNLPLHLIALADTSGNALPSLHASLAVYCALCSAQLLNRRGLRVAVLVWTLFILASTLLAKRHALVDVAAGAALGALAYWALFRPRPREEADCGAWKTTFAARRFLAQGIASELEPLFLPDARKRLAELGCFFTLASAGFGLSLWGWKTSLWPPLAGGIVASAVALNAFVLLMHDGMHGTLFQKPAWNRVGSVILGSTFLMSFSAYRILHARHHRFLGDPRDPDDYQNYVRPRLLLWSLHFVRLTLGSLLYLALIPMLALKYGTDNERRRVLNEYLFLVAVYSALGRCAPTGLLFFAWFVPLLIVGSLTAMRGFTQHGITNAKDPFLASRTVLPNRIVGFLLLHENYHLEHHLFPEVPSYHLPRLHRLVWKRLPRAVSSSGYLSFLGKFLRATPRMDDTPIGLEHPSRRSV
jgi:fatty acid desaturase/membrane-associated phospholipid phosphatase